MTGDIRAELDRLHGAHEALAAVVRDLVDENAALKLIVFSTDSRYAPAFVRNNQEWFAQIKKDIQDKRRKEGT